MTVRTTYLDLAQQWREMAEQAETVGREEAAVVETQRRLRQQLAILAKPRLDGIKANSATTPFKTGH